MASKTIVVLTDDIDGGEADKTVTFSLDGNHYEIELNNANIGRLSDALEPFISAARKSSNAPRQSAAPASNLAEVRAWARTQGFQVSDRGRVSAEIMEAYAQRN